MVTTSKSSKVLDFIILSLFTIFITAQPFYLHHEIIMMETGIHLPAISAIFKGAIPYRDFFYLRGPLELYVPAFLMLLLGQETFLLPAFYYVGSVATLFVGVLLAHQIFRTRLFLWIIVPVLIARTFPRVSFYYWGGMRYALGLFFLYYVVLFCKTRRLLWMGVAGIISSLGLLTTIETGIATIIAVSVTLMASFFFRMMDRRIIMKAVFAYAFGILVILIPYLFYLVTTNSLTPYVETNYTILTQMTRTFIDAPGNHPESFLGFLKALVPNSPYFKLMTPIFCYISFAFYLVFRLRNKSFPVEMLPIAIYGLILYIAAFRKIEGHHFEMALQPEKILLFFLFERLYFFLKDKRDSIWVSIKEVKLKRVYLFQFFVFCLIGSSLGYSVQRFNHRFTMFKIVRNKITGKDIESLKPLQGQETKRMELARLRNMTIPRWQADEIEGVVAFIQTHTHPDEAIFYYPEVGNFAFWADRPFVGRFPVATFSWMGDEWHRELFDDFKKATPRYVVMTHLGHRTFPEEWYFRNKSNVGKFQEITNLILDNYVLVKSFESVGIYQRKDLPYEGQR